ncbi:FAD-dependent monooxygenase [Lentzea sp. NPDC005914]|uniref:FAD-dependent monooxygenase n=1 Tax=Lentzea sp. NPDC005914 TaxID=3154572 RepID=UPI0033BFE833
MAVAHVVGAGIAGLAAALALHAEGWSVRVFERSADLRATGGGIGITPNGVLALDEIGVGRVIRARSVVQLHGGVRTPNGRWLARSSLDFVERRYGRPILALPRTSLVRTLAEALPPGAVEFGARAEPVHLGDRGTPAVLRVGDAELESDLLVGADGIRSAVRRAIFPQHPGLRSGGSVSWRAIVPARGLMPDAAETWGRGLRFSVLPLPGDEVHFSALARIAVRRGADRPHDLFGGWHDPIPLLLERASAIFFDEIEELTQPLDGFASGRTVLVGDAAHPMTPNVGSANLALEDAVELARATTPGRPLSGGLARYDEMRRPRTTRLSRMSRWMGRVAELSSPSAVALRNGGTWLGGFLPEAVSRRSMDTMVGWVPSSQRST